MSWEWWASFRLRLLLRGAFIALVLAIVAMAGALLREEKQRSHDHYRDSASKTLEQISARLRHPAGQLALLNPQRAVQASAGQPLMLPFAALDFDDQHKVRNAVDMAGCLAPGAQGTGLCVAIGNNPWGGAYIYTVASLRAPALQPHTLGDERLEAAHRLRVSLHTPRGLTQWIAPYEVPQTQTPTARHGRFTGYTPRPEGNYRGARPVRDFRAWVWQDGACDGTEAPAEVACSSATFVSLRLPVEAFRDALFSGQRPVWPPADLAQYRVRLELLAPGDETPVYDSDSESTQGPWALGALQALLLPGEQLRISHQGRSVAELQAPTRGNAPQALLGRLVRWLPVQREAGPVRLHDEVRTAQGSYDLELVGNAQGVDQVLAEVAARLSWFVGAMLVAVGLVWLLIEVGLMRPIARLTRRTRGLAQTLHSHGEGLERFELSDLRGRNEMGLLASALDELLRRVKDDTLRERLRALQEKDMWHAVGHEILSPLQSLLVLHPAENDPSARYLRRMQQAVQVLYGQASPSEALQASRLSPQTLDLHQFLQQVVEHAGVTDLLLQAPTGPVWVCADEYGLEDVLSHILANAQRHRQSGSPITLVLRSDAHRATLEIHNQGAPIPPQLLERIFEYGVSDASHSTPGQRGQGLFVAKTYLAKMGGSVRAENRADGVCFTLELQRAAGAP